ncbi:Pkinase-domain-containing protein [Ascobolus immersus RN42]|uniref:non-specific serine/threonine protein kinase n=1 Tax=Ascobolus immersus RN42 TaxID=1160509 RepID=A0A3N4INE4_ASCIM|nr:Pkinase-domain-containing protein [Ascobolus immersus RN42]
MSNWKLPKSLKQLKETHLGSSPSNSSLKQTPSTSTLGEGESSAQDSSSTATIKPGVLIVTLHEAKGLTLPGASSSGRPGSSAAAAGSYAAGSVQSRPPQPGTAGHSRQLSKLFRTYCVLEFDKNQVVVNAISGTLDNPSFSGYSTSYKFDVSRPSDLHFSIYMRNPGSNGRDEDLFLGSCKVTPKLEEPAPAAQQSSKRSQPSSSSSGGQSGVEWVPFSSGMGQVKVGVEYRVNQNKSLTIEEDFELLKIVGKGSFGKVIQVKKKDTQRIYAMKCIRKAHIISRSEVNHTLAERTVLAQINNPFIVPLKFSFQSPDKLYLVLAFVNGGELFHHLQKEGKFDVNRARFYTAELLCALECLHGFNVIYRDLKPENILLDYTGHIALCDFGLCKLNMKEDDRTNTFCGTPEYLAPELLLGKGYTKSVDWWTLGVLLYEMLTGLPPFYDENTNEMYRKIVQEPLTFPGPEIVPADAKDLLTRLLDRDPERRLGARGAAEIKSHAFFESIDWKRLLQKKIQPTFRPNVADATDVKNFDTEFTSEVPTDSVVDGDFLSQSVQQQFTGWSYNRPEQLGPDGMSIRDAGSVMDESAKGSFFGRG